MSDHLLIGEIGYRRAFEARTALCLALHECIQYRLQRLVISGYSTGTIHITCDSYKAVSCSGKIHLQSMLSVVHVVDGLVVGEVR